MASLRRWLDEADRRSRELEEAQDEWEELQGLLAGRTVDHLEQIALRRVADMVFNETYQAA